MRDIEDVPGADPDHLYNCTKRPGEVRVFCEHRWRESHRLPDIVEALDKCYFTGRGNYFIWRSPTDPARGEYFVFFALSVNRSRHVDLQVQSAYQRTDGNRLKRAGATTLRTLVSNLMRGRRTLDPLR